jgi:hypothetical protein
MSTWSISSAFARILDRAAERYRAHKSARDLIGLDHDEVERILRDVNLNMSDMAAITRPHAGPEVMLPQRLQLVGLDPHYIAATDIATYRDLQRSCMSCRSWRRCARDLARGEAQVGLASYCLNSQLIDGLLVGRLDASQARRITLQGSSAGAVNAE